MLAELLLPALTIAPSPGPLCSVGSVREDGTDDEARASVADGTLLVFDTGRRVAAAGVVQHVP